MKERKYKEDWVNETRFDEKTGREKRVPVYRGDWYHLSGDRTKRKLLLEALLPWIGFVALILAYYKLNFPGATVLYRPVCFPACRTQPVPCPLLDSGRRRALPDRRKNDPPPERKRHRPDPALRRRVYRLRLCSDPGRHRLSACGFTGRKGVAGHADARAGLRTGLRNS